MRRSGMRASVAATLVLGTAASILATTSQATMDESDTVVLAAEALGSSPHGQIWLLRYGPVADPRAAFELRLGPPHPATAPGFSFADGVLFGRGGRQPDAFIRALSAALGAGPKWQHRPHAAQLSIQVGILGDSLTRTLGASRGQVIAGEFTDTPRGSWLVTKLFFNDDRGEVFLALSATERTGLLIAKEPEYGPEVVAEFARLFR
jgi:hypothetical protein